ncbi:MAG TPA: diaminopimelate epimerase [Bacillota bacterium]|nr:diaminopimelate epimerase [Bacillota bacterium]
MKFTKVQGLGNDFVMVNCLEETNLPNYSLLAQKVCDRNFGVGADGLVLILPAELPGADIRMRIINPDGSEPEMCGTAIRCLAKYVYAKGILPKTIINVETLGGMRIPQLILEGGKVIGIRVDMGEPILERGQIPMNGTAGKVVNEPLVVDGREFAVTAVSMGNPHCITFVDKIDEAEVMAWGPKLEVHPAFPRKTNVEFVQVVSPDEVIMRVWERGAGPTLACGTGACATGVAAALNNKTGRKVTVHLKGGDLLIEWAENNHVYMTGPGEEVFTGEYFLK